MKYLTTLLLAVLLGGCSALNYQKPEISLSDIQPGKTTLFEQSFDVTLRVKNPNQLALNAKGLSFDLNVGGEKLGSGVSNQAIAIPALGEGLVSLQLHTSLPAWLRQIGNLTQPNGKISYELKGSFKGVNGLADLPFSSKGEWRLPNAK